MGMLASLTFCLLEEEPFVEEEDIVRGFSVFSSCRYLSFGGFSFFLFDNFVFLFSLTYLQTFFFTEVSQVRSVGENRSSGQLSMKFIQCCLEKMQTRKCMTSWLGGVDSVHCSSLTCLHVLHVSTYSTLPTKQLLHVCKVRSGLRFTSVVEVGGMVSPKRVY